MLLCINSEGHALQVTGLEKKTEDISRPFLYFGRRQEADTHALYFSVFEYMPFFRSSIKEYLSRFEQEVFGAREQEQKTSHTCVCTLRLENRHSNMRHCFLVLENRKYVQID